MSKAAVGLTAIPSFDGECDGDDCDANDDGDDEAINRSGTTCLKR